LASPTAPVGNARGPRLCDVASVSRPRPPYSAASGSSADPTLSINDPNIGQMRPHRLPRCKVYNQRNSMSARVAVPIYWSPIDVQSEQVAPEFWRSMKIGGDCEKLPIAFGRCAIAPSASAVSIPGQSVKRATRRGQTATLRSPWQKNRGATSFENPSGWNSVRALVAEIFNSPHSFGEIPPLMATSVRND